MAREGEGSAVCCGLQVIAARLDNAQEGPPPQFLPNCPMSKQQRDAAIH
jgi:hypothetical protein